MSIDSGLLIINKEKGFTSFDVVAKLRGILHIKKIGHTGTLDPDAEGVLCVCIGKATKLVEELMDHDKEYETTLLLGTVTDTQDISGEVIRHIDQIDVSENELLGAITHFIGDIDQVPPMYSAKKVNGQRLYEAARNGQEVARKPVRIHIDDISVIGYDMPRADLRISCSKGTYIRTLCNDIGECLGCGGCMERLLRTRVGEYKLSQAHRLSEIEAAAREDEISSLIIPVEEVLSGLPAFLCNEAANKKLINGNRLELSELTPIDGAKPSERIRVYTHEGTFAAVYRADDRNYKVDKFFL